MAKIEKTHAMRVLEAKGIDYRVTVYDASGAFHSGEDAAALVGAPPEAVYKTLVVLREGPAPARPLIAMIPSNTQLDLKLLATAIGEKKLRMATQREAEQLTGMQVGGISTLGLRRPTFDVLLDEAAQSLDRIHLSAGARGIDIELRVADLVAVTAARFARTTV
jgi:Cys-tRNA(Pro)/Cys-tRNA(Cys) deacylase